MISTQTIFFALGSLQFPYLAIGFLPKTFPSISSYKHFAQMSYEDIPTGDAAASTGSIRRHPSELPGDPSLVLVTNLDLGDKKLDVMKKCSKAISDATGKPEAYIGVSITDNASVLFGYVQYSMHVFNVLCFLDQLGDHSISMLLPNTMVMKH
mmetsp:Transcript_101106/g.205149  ORF Transcript_101106/g.205149 Transcript_101106/m.205149 type:complete len:153 (-) Transcript_101106:1546-2004(-)